jgi:hypothetical protein
MAIMVVGADLIFIVGAAVAAGSGHQAEDHIRYRSDIATCDWKLPRRVYYPTNLRSISDLVAIIYPNEQKAEDVRQRLLNLQKEYLISLGDAVIAVKTDGGQIKLNQLVNTTAAGAASGSFRRRAHGLRNQQRFHEGACRKYSARKRSSIRTYQAYDRG